MDYTGFPTKMLPMRSVCNACGFVISGVRASTILDAQQDHSVAVHLPSTPTSGTLQP